jgi:methylthioribose-1-phosphate isomerase
MSQKEPDFEAIRWEDDHLAILDQTFLPEREVYIDLQSAGQVWDAIKKLKIRGAPAIGIAGAYALYLGMENLPETNFKSFYSECERLSEYIASARPTAVNLSWALKRMLSTIYSQKEKSIEEIRKVALETAKTIHDEDRRLCKAIGEHGLELVPEDAGIMTHCNTGSLATGKYGTAFSVILHAFKDDRLRTVWVNETRPLLQGSRLTSWELKKLEIPHQLHVDSAAAFLMQQGKVDLVITGADRIARNGDTANKIGTYSLALLADAHDIPFYIAAPHSTIDMESEEGSAIEIEEREAEEVTHFGNRQTAPDKVEVYNPAFDITPHKLITGFITEKGVIKPDFGEKFKKMFG